MTQQHWHATTDDLVTNNDEAARNLFDPFLLFLRVDITTRKRAMHHNEYPYPYVHTRETRTMNT